MDFWLNFIAGMASGIAVGLLAVVLRKFFRRSEKQSSLKLNKRTLGAITLGIIIIATVGAIIVLALNGMEIPSPLYAVFIMSAMFFYMLV